MQNETIKLRNGQNEKLDVLLSGNYHASTAIVFAHGFGANKDENSNLFVDIATSLEKDFRIIRFDFSGYGKSEGRQEDVNLDKMKGDLATVVEYAKGTHKKVFIVAHSLGTFATMLLKPLGVERIVFTSTPNSDTKLLIENMQARITNNGGRVNEKGTTLYKRTNGDTQTIGSSFWETLRGFNPIGHTKMLSHYSSLATFDPQDDEVLKSMSFDHLVIYDQLGIKSKALPGDHNFTNPDDRNRLIAEINSFFRKVKMVFIAHPISGDVENNIKKVLDICEDVHSETIIPVFPSLLWRNYLGHKPEHEKLIQKVNEELFRRHGVDEVWYYGDGTISSGMKNEIKLAVKWRIPNIGKTPKMAFELTKEVDVE